MTRFLIAAFIWLGLIPISIAAAKSVQHLASPTHFLDGKKKTQMLAGIRRNMDQKIGFNHHYSIAFVACGIACGSNWFVDRRNGEILEAPDNGGNGVSYPDIIVRSDSDVVRVVYYPDDGSSAGGCSEKTFRLVGRRFLQLTELRPAKCSL